MGSNYVVMSVNIVIWVGIFLFLLRLDKKAKELEKSK
jgi:CcmD family protein